MAELEDFENPEEPVAVADLWSMYPVDEIVDWPKQNWLVEDMLMENSLSVLYGPSGAGKTFWALDLSLQLSQQVPVVYITLESVEGYPKRIEAWRTVHQHRPQQLHFMFGDVPVMMNDTPDHLIDYLRSLSPRLIVVDSLARSFWGGDETSSLDMRKFIRAWQYVQKDLSAALLLVHSIDGVHNAGFTMLRNGADTVLYLTEENDRVRLQVMRARDYAPPPDRYYQRQTVLLPNGESSCVLVPNAA